MPSVISSSFCPYSIPSRGDRHIRLRSKIHSYFAFCKRLNRPLTPPAHAKIVVTTSLPGDANGDGQVNAPDITKVERIIVGLDTATPGADANQDGKINALDITKVERIIAGLD